VGRLHLRPRLEDLALRAVPKAHERPGGATSVFLPADPFSRGDPMRRPEDAGVDCACRLPTAHIEGG